MKILRSMGTVGGFTLGSRVFGFLRDMLIATVLGAGTVTDALVIAIKLPSIFRRILAEGALSAAFIPIFSRLYTQEGLQKARAFAEEVFSFLFAFMVLFVVAVEVVLPAILTMYMPGLDTTPERLSHAIQFSRITFPFIFFISLCGLYSAILNSFERFIAVASSPLAGNIFIIGFVCALLPFVVENKGHLFAISVLGCGIVQLLWVMIPTHKTYFPLRLHWPRLTENVKKMLKLMGPVAVSSGLHQFNVLIGVAISSLLPVGGISFLYYAERLNQLPTSTIGTALATVMLPLLARQIRSHQKDRANESQNQALEFALLFTLPAMVGLVCLAEPIIIVLFKSGAFTLDDARQTAYALMALAAGLPAYILVKLLSATFYAYEDTKTPLFYALCAVVFDIVLALLLLKPLEHIGIAIATAASAWAYALGLGIKLNRCGYFSLTPRMISIAPRLALASLAVAGATLAMKAWAYPYFFMSKSYQTTALAIIIVSGVVLYGIIGSWLGAINFKYLKQHFAKDTQA